MERFERSQKLLESLTVAIHAIETKEPDTQIVIMVCKADYTALQDFRLTFGFNDALRLFHGHRIIGIDGIQIGEYIIGTKNEYLSSKEMAEENGIKGLRMK